MPFASLALVPPEMVGMSILPQSMFAVVLILKVLAPQLMPLSPKLLTALRLQTSGVFGPLFAGRHCCDDDHAKAFRRGNCHIADARICWEQLTCLSPTTQNFTQFGYVTLSVMTVFAVTLMADEPGFTETLAGEPCSLEASSASSPVLSISQRRPPGWKACSSHSEMRIMPI